MSDRTPKRRRALKIAAALLVVALGYTGYDLLVPVRTDLREFDPDDVARLETAMWRSYYSRERLRLFLELAELMRRQYHLPFLRSNVVALRAAKAAFVFKDGKNRAEYERALPDLVSFYESLHAASATPFDVREAARLELEWWIVHRQRGEHVMPADLGRALAELPAAIYHLPADRFAEHARLRTEAMRIRDTRADEGGVTEEDWARIDELLHESWRSLHQTVNR
jgi:hypothetical protein